MALAKECEEVISAEHEVREDGMDPYDDRGHGRYR